MGGRLAYYVARPLTILATLIVVALWPAVLAQGQFSSTAGGAAAQPASGVSAGESHRLPQDVLQVINWLPEDTESIVLVRGPLQKGVLKDFRDPPPLSMSPSNSPAPALAPVPIRRPLSDFRQESLVAFTSLFGLSGKAFIRNISDHEVCLVVAAAQGFGRPVIGGASTYKGGQIIVFRNAIPDVGVQAKAHEQVSLVQIERNGVVRLDSGEKWGEKDDRFTVYYAKPKPSVLIAATDVRFLKTMLQRIARPPVSRTPVLGFPEWKYVDVESSVWGVRHRRTATPIYILAKAEKNGLPFPQLSGVSFSYEFKPATRVTYRFHFPEGVQNAVRRAAVDGSGAKLVAPSVVEYRSHIRTHTGGREPGLSTPADAAFMVQHLMGYVVCP